MIWLGVLIGLVVVAVLVVQRFRGSALGTSAEAGELLEDFEEMRSRGDIDDADYRKIKSVLGARFHGKQLHGKQSGGTEIKDSSDNV